MKSMTMTCMRRGTILLIAMFFVSGCTTVEFVRKDLTPKKSAVLRYAPQSDPGREAEFRAKMNQKANDFCGGKFEITREFEARDETGTSTGIGTGIGVGSGRGFGTGVIIGGSAPNTAMYHFVEIACL